MTILDACQKVALRVLGSKPISMFTPSQNKQTVAEILDLAEDVAIDIARSHDWQALTAIHTITGNGAETAFPLPEDYGRMLLASGVIDPKTWFWGYQHIPTVMEWLAEESHGWRRITPGAWIVLEDRFTFVPAPGNGAEARFPYISRNIVKPAAGARKANFTADTDSFVLDERLLTLGTLWRWKEQKGLEYAEDMRNYEIALSQAQARDAGGRTIRARAGKGPRGITTGWPWPLGGGA